VAAARQAGAAAARRDAVTAPSQAEEARLRRPARRVFATRLLDLAVSTRDVGAPPRQYRASPRFARLSSLRGVADSGGNAVGQNAAGRTAAGENAAGRTVAGGTAAGTRVEVRAWRSPDSKRLRWWRDQKATRKGGARSASRQGPVGPRSGRTWRDRSPENRLRGARWRSQPSRRPRRAESAPLATLAATEPPRRPTARALLSGCWMRRPRRTNAFLT
jgi:hypothetical protein